MDHARGGGAQAAQLPGWCRRGQVGDPLALAMQKDASFLVALLGRAGQSVLRRASDAGSIDVNASGRGNGGQIRKKGLCESQEGHAGAEEGHSEKWTVGEKGKEPEAGDCYRSVSGAALGGEGPAQEVLTRLDGARSGRTQTEESTGIKTDATKWRPKTL
jgi:hypothetical protein